MRGGEFRLFLAWAATAALLVVGLPMFILGLPLVISGLAGLIYLARRRPYWPGVLGVVAGFGAVLMLGGVAVALTADDDGNGLALIGSAAGLVIGAFLTFLRETRRVTPRQRRGAGSALDHRAQRQSFRAIRLLPIWVALAVFFVPSGLVWIYGNTGQFSSQGEFACFDAFPGTDETAEITDEPSLWPPGGKCLLHHANGDVSERSKDAPVLEWIFALLAPFAGAGTWVYLKLLQAAQPA